jgi:hypothetical protein
MTMQSEGWHLRKEVNVGHLLMTVTLAAGLVAWGQQIDQRVTRLEVLAESHREAQDRAIQVLEARFDRIERKLDRLVEMARQ